jgi:hypothetical protein
MRVDEVVIVLSEGDLFENILALWLCNPVYEQRPVTEVNRRNHSGGWRAN